MREEASFLRDFGDHPNVVKLHEFVEGELNFFVVMEIVPQTLLETIVESHFDEALIYDHSERTFSVAFRQILTGLAHLHAQGVAHLDIKPDNVLVGEDGRIRLCDFGLAARVPLRRDFHTLLFCPPEIIVEGWAYAATDLWACGVLLFVALTGYFPILGGGAEALRRQIRQGVPPHVLATAPISRSARDLVSRLLQVDPRRRLTACDALQHPWFASASDHALPDVCADNLKALRARQRMKKAMRAVRTAVRMSKGSRRRLREGGEEDQEGEEEEKGEHKRGGEGGQAAAAAAGAAVPPPPRVRRMPSELDEIF